MPRYCKCKKCPEVATNDDSEYCEECIKAECVEYSTLNCQREDLIDEYEEWERPV